jgi:hypothetical protein
MLYKYVGLGSLIGKMVDNTIRAEAVRRENPVLFSELDEAINSLRASATQNVSIANERLLRFPALLVFWLFAMVIMLVARQVSQIALTIEQNALTRISYVFGFDGSFGVLQDVASTAWVALASLTLAYLVTRLGASWIAAIWVNGLFKASVVAKAYGADGGRPLGYVSPNPYVEREFHWKPLPREFDIGIQSKLDAHAMDTVRAARSALAISVISGSHDLVEAISSSMIGNELVHTNYFQSEILTQFIAWILVAKCGFPPGDKFSLLDACRFSKWYTEISPAGFDAKVTDALMRLRG